MGRLRRYPTGRDGPLLRTDLSGEHVTISRSYSSHSRETTAPKNGRERIVTVPPVVTAALEDVPHHPSGLIFETPAAKQWTHVAQHHYWRRLRLLADRPGFDFYELRHCAATMLLERAAGRQPRAFREQLGRRDRENACHH